jgi:hypothetical protein
VSSAAGARGARVFAASAALIVLLAVAGFAALRFALHGLERRIVAAFGSGSRIDAVRLDLASVEVEGLVIPGGDGWPAPESLRARRLRVTPSWRSLLSERVEIARVDVVELYVSALRPREGGLQVLPSMIGAEGGPDAPAAPASAQRSVRIAEIRVSGGAIDLYDATIARPPWRVRLTGVDATLRDVVAPALDGRIAIEASALLDGPRRDGRASLSGWLVPATRDCELAAELASADLLALQPYVVEAAKARLARGTLDLGLRATVREQRIHAPGTLAISDLAFAEGGSAAARVLGVPRDLVLAGLRMRGGRIALDFTVEGRLDDPRFSVNEAIAMRAAVELAEELGFSVGGLVEGTLGIGRDSLDGAGRAAQGIGSSLKRLLER